MVTTGMALAMLPGLFNGLFNTPVKFDSRWRWENTGRVEVVVSCLAMPGAVVSLSASGWFRVLGQAAGYGVVAALLFGLLSVLARSVLAGASTLYGATAGASARFPI